MSIENLLPKVQKNISLAEHTTFQIGGRAKYFFEAQTKKDLIRAIEAAISLGSPFFILGKGSNVLASDEEYKGLIINCQMSRLRLASRGYGGQVGGQAKVEITCEAGVILKDLVLESVKRGFTGLEWAAGIPGTIGGAVRGNAGAFGKSIGDPIKEVEVLEINPGRTEGVIIVKKFSKDECNFNYRSSIFKEKKNLIILSASFEFEKGDKEKIKKQIKENLDYRKKNHPLNFPSAGSIFKNPPPLREREVVGGKPPYVPAAQLIGECGLGGKKIGQAQISEKHCNFIINLDEAKAKDVKVLIKLIKKEVKKKFGIELEEEIQFIQN